MKFNPYKGIYHSNPEYAWRERDLTLCVAVKPEYSTDPKFSVSYKVNGNRKTVPMAFYESFGDAHIFTATIPHEDFENVSLFDYAIEDGIFTLSIHEVSILPIPVLPPIVITEVYSRPIRGRKHTRFIELTNISNEPADLYDFKIEKTSEGDTVSTFLADAPGKNILDPGETACIRFLIPESFDDEGNIKESTEEYLRGIYAENPYKRGEYRDAKVLDVDTTSVDIKTGLRVIKPDAFVLGKNQKPNYLNLSHRSGDEKYNFSLTLNRDYKSLDILCARSALFSVDPADVHNGKHIRRNADATPGVLEDFIPIPIFKKVFAPLVIVNLPTAQHLQSEGDLKIEYTVFGECNDSFVTLFLPDEEKTIYPEKEGNKYTLTVSSEIVLTVKELKLSITADNGDYITHYGSKAEPVSLAITDNVGPSVNMISPKPRFCFTDDEKQVIFGELSDVSGVNIPMCRISLDKEDITDSVSWQGTRFSYLTKKVLKPGEHKLKITAYDMLGNSSVSSVKFSVAPYENMNCYRGEVHTHTAESDAVGTPLEAMLSARDAAGMDFFAVTEHSSYLIDDKYKNQIKLANEMNEPGKFAALYGWEMTWAHQNGLWGHMNLIGCKDVVLNKDDYSLGTFYEWMANHGGVAMFNHPGYSWGNFEEYRIPAEIANKNAALAEIKGIGYDREYQHMLKRGYKVSPVYNEDNHSGTWGIANDWYGYVLAPYLSRENVMDAFRKRRTYSTSDKTLKLKYSINGRWMGEEIDYANELNVKVDLSTELESGIGRIQLFASNGIIVSEINVGLRKNYTWEFTLPTEYPYYYVRIIGKDKYTVTSPVWIKQDKSIKLESLSTFSSFTDEFPLVCKMLLRNNTDEPLKEVRADIYLAPLSGVSKDDIPYVTAYCGKLKVGEKIDISRKLPVVSGNRVANVVISAEGKSRKYYDFEAVFLSQLQIAEILPLSAPYTAKNADGEEYTVQNPFPYVKLYNSSCREISLAETSVRLWNTTGKGPVDSQICPLSGVIKPESVFVVWKRKDKNLTVDDFNKRYGTDFVEGNNIFVTDKAITKSNSGYKRVDIFQKGEVISRVEYNYCLESLENEISEDKAFNYAYVSNFTGTSKRLADYTRPNPSSVYDEQIPGFIIGGAKKKELKAEKKSEKSAEKKKSEGKVSIPALGGVAAAGATVGALLGVALKATKAPSPSAQAKADAKLLKKTNAKIEKKNSSDEVKRQKQSEKRIVKAVAKTIDKTVDKKIHDRNSALIDSRIKSDKDSIKSAKKNIKALTAQKKAEKATAKRESEIKKEQDKQ